MSRASRNDLTTTSYALLGLLNVKPWTTYELAGQMDKGLGKFWPRARSLLFKEPQKLIAQGLAKATRGRVGRRSRTVYAITAKGRRALAVWLRTPGDGPTLEWEGLVKVFFAEGGTKEDLLRSLNAIREWSDERMRYQREKARSHLEGEGSFQQRVPITTLTGGFLAEYELLVGDWARRSIATVEGWPEDIINAKPDRSALERYSQIGLSRSDVQGAG